MATQCPLTLFDKTPTPVRSNQVFSCETIGIPTAIYESFLDDPEGIKRSDHKINPFLLASPLPFVVLNAIVAFVRTTDTPLAYDTGKTFARGILKDSKVNWTPRKILLDQLADLERRFAKETLGKMEFVRNMFLSMHFKRCKGVSLNPLDNSRDFVVLISSVEAGLKFFDITASDDPAQNFDSKPTPRRRAHSFEPAPGDKKACIYCYNRQSSEENLKKCGRCLSARYCDKKCQVLDWPVHKAKDCVK